MPAYRFFDHTGDFGADLAADSVEGVLEASARALVVLMTDAEDAVDAREARAIVVTGVDDADLMVALGNELLFLFEVDGWLAARVEVTALGDGRLEATAHGEPFDAGRHAIARPLKAVTHHGARIARDGAGGWTGRVVFDV